MKVVTATFVRSALRPQEYPQDNRPEIAFAGRSNVGKSSLLNCLLHRKDLAKTSKTPGKTRTVNFFEINGRFYFVDLPGYGFAKVPKPLKRAWGEVITSYVSGRTPLRMVVHLIDSRHPPTPNDHQLLELLENAQVPALLVATKFDKLNQSQRRASIETIRKGFHLDDEAVIIPFSSVTGTGVKELWRYIEECL